MMFRSFYARISFLFLLLVLILGGISLIIAFRASRHLFDEVEQLLNREYAASISMELKPLVKEEFSETAIKEAIHYMMVLNPMVEIYLLDQEGAVLCYFTLTDEELLQQSVDLGPVRQFIGTQGLEPVLGDDPRSPGERKPFSAASLDMGGEQGYVYVILRGQSYDRSLAMLQSNYYLRSGFLTFFIALCATVFAGFMLFFLLTLRLRRLSSGVKAFEKGQLDYRVDIAGKDELGALGLAFNRMAESIEEGVEKLHRSEEQRSDLIANISHDLRSPLTSIRGHLETLMIKEESIGPEERRVSLENVLHNVKGFQQMVEELFELARLEARQVSLREEVFPVAELVQDVLMAMAPRAEEVPVSLHFNPPEDSIRIGGDIALLERVLRNVVENALAHSPAKGVVELGLRSRDGQVELTVSDQGPGIPVEDLPHIFERFYRADKSRSPGGTGLGLAIAREIVELHGGRITAENLAGGGACFRILLLPSL